MVICVSRNERATSKSAQESLIAPHRFVMPKGLSAGKHIIAYVLTIESDMIFLQTTWHMLIPMTLRLCGMECWVR